MEATGEPAEFPCFRGPHREGVTQPHVEVRDVTPRDTPSEGRTGDCERSSHRKSWFNCVVNSPSRPLGGGTHTTCEWTPTLRFPHLGSFPKSSGRTVTDAPHRCKARFVRRRNCDSRTLPDRPLSCRRLPHATAVPWSDATPPSYPTGDVPTTPRPLSSVGC